MEKIFITKTFSTMTERTEVKYKSIDGLMFNRESDCVAHERECYNWFNIYKRLHKLIPRAYSLPELKKKLKELESNEKEWQNASSKDWYDYMASLYGLKAVINFIGEE